MHLTATPATEIARTEIQEETNECHKGKDKIEDDACPIKRRHGEERVQAHAHAQECEQIEKSLSERQLTEHLVDCCQEEDEQKPEEQNKDAEHQGQGERIESGMEIETHPHVWFEPLDVSIEDSGSSQDNHEEGGINRGNVIEQEDAAVGMTHMAYQQECQCQHDKAHKERQVAQAEEIDKTADGVVGHHTGEQVLLVYPSHELLVASHLHPHAIYRILGDNRRLSYHQFLSPEHEDAVGEYGRGHGHIVHGLLHLQMHGIGSDHEIIIDLIETRLLCSVVTGGEQQEQQEEREITHSRLSFHTDGSRTPNGSDAHRKGSDTRVPRPAQGRPHACGTSPTHSSSNNDRS